MALQAPTTLSNVGWQPQPQAAALVQEILDELCGRCSDLRRFAQDLRLRTGTRLLDWTDHFAVPSRALLERRLEESGFQAAVQGGAVTWYHPGGLFPRVVSRPRAAWSLTIQVESVADFLAARGLDGGTTIQGFPLAQLRKARVLARDDTEFWVVERHGFRGWEPPDIGPETIGAVRWHQQAFRRRSRNFEDEGVGWDQAEELIRAAAADLGAGWAADLFFAAERAYWTGRNRAAQAQKSRQDALGLGWGNHDHHTYRSSRRHFARLIALLEKLGLVCRERFYAGREAGWGAQVLEQEEAGVVVFADVDLTPAEVTGDFAHEPLPAAQEHGTVGLWCLLHGEAFWQPGMHHLECRFDFEAARTQLQQHNVRVMKPFTDLPYLKQAFTEGDFWPVADCRLEAALAAGALTPGQAGKFRESGAVGSHLEILQRDQGYKGFNQSGINEIIRQTDPRGYR